MSYNYVWCHSILFFLSSVKFIFFSDDDGQNKVLKLHTSKVNEMTCLYTSIGWFIKDAKDVSQKAIVTLNEEVKNITNKPKQIMQK